MGRTSTPHHSPANTHVDFLSASRYGVICGASKHSRRCMFTVYRTFAMVCRNATLRSTRAPETSAQGWHRAPTAVRKHPDATSSTEGSGMHFFWQTIHETNLRCHVCNYQSKTLQNFVKQRRKRRRRARTGRHCVSFGSVEPTAPPFGVRWVHPPRSVCNLYGINSRPTDRLSISSPLFIQIRLIIFGTSRSQDDVWSAPGRGASLRTLRNDGACGGKASFDRQFRVGR